MEPVGKIIDQVKCRATKTGTGLIGPDPALVKTRKQGSLGPVCVGSIMAHAGLFDRYAAEQRTMLYYRDLSAYRMIPQTSIHPGRMPHFKWLDRCIR